MKSGLPIRGDDSPEKNRKKTLRERVVGSGGGKNKFRIKTLLHYKKER